MGGGGDHGHHEPFKVPHWSHYSKYRTETPELADYEKRLSRLGLRDPWVRNYVHFFKHKPKWHKQGKHGVWLFMWQTFRPGLKPGAVLAGSIIAIEELYSRIRYGHTSWGGHWAEEHHDHGHGEGHH